MVYRPLIFVRRKDPMPTVILLVPLLVTIVGALMYALATNSKVSEMGKIAFFVGLLVLVWGVAGPAFRV
jgi:Na+/phosphate symporter